VSDNSKASPPQRCQYRECDKSKCSRHMVMERKPVTSQVPWPPYTQIDSREVSTGVCTNNHEING
jgi:hypothetical protein